MECYHNNTIIQHHKIYKVDKFLRRWNDVGANTTFVSGGRYFVILGKNLELLIKRSAEFEDEEEITWKSKKKRNFCFLQVMNNRHALIEQYKKLFYTSPKPSKTQQAFNNLCIRPRKNRYNNRQSFNYLVYKQLQCQNCKNKCVFEALKTFYLMDSKCVSQLKSLFSKDEQNIC